MVKDLALTMGTKERFGTAMSIFSSSRLLTGSSDTTAKLWDVESGKELFEFKHQSGVRSVGFAHGGHMFLTVQDNQYSKEPTIFIFNNEDEISKQSQDPVRAMVGDGTGKINCALWGALNMQIISCSDDGSVRLWDVEKGVEIQKSVEHKKAVNSIQFSKDHSMFISASADMTSKLFDSRTLKVIKSYQSDRPLNSAAISPLMNHVILGGGQEARNVTTTRSQAGHFEVDFFHSVYQCQLGSVKGHFGPVNTLAFNPDGRSYASGSEDGYIRLQHFDKDYFNTKYNY